MGIVVGFNSDTLLGSVFGGLLIGQALRFARQSGVEEGGLNC